MSKVFELHVWNGKRYEYELTEYNSSDIKEQYNEYINDNYKCKIITKRLNNERIKKESTTEILRNTKSTRVGS